MARRVSAMRDFGVKPLTASLVQTSSNETQELAYRISQEDLTILLSEEYVSETLADNEYIIGVQFEFKNLDAEAAPDGELEPAPFLRIRQITYNPDKVASTSNPFRKITPPNADLFSTAEQAFVIIENQEIFMAEGQVGTHKWYTLSEQNIATLELEAPLNNRPNSFTDFEFYTDDIVLVYFTKDQLLPLKDYFDAVILSGCQIGFGKKLNRIPRERDGIPMGGYYFSLKLEGLKESASVPPPDEETANRIVQMTSLFTDDDQMENEEETIAPDLVLGHRCPPDWYLFRRVVEGILNTSDEATRQLILDNYNQLRVDFLQEVVLNSNLAS